MKSNPLRSARLAWPIALLLTAGCSPEHGGQASSGNPVIQLANPGPAAEIVNGDAVPARLVDALARSRNWNLERPGMRERALRELASYVVAAQASRTEDLASLDLPAMAELARLQAVSTATVMAFENGGAIDDATLRAEFDKQIARTGGNDYDVTQLIFRDEAAATKAAAEIAAGKPFDKVSAAQKKDAVQVRSIKRARPIQLTEPVVSALAAMKPGDTTKTPVHSALGWQVVRLDAVTPRAVPTFDQVKDSLRRTMAKRAGEERLMKLRAEAKITLPDGSPLPASTGQARGAPVPAGEAKKTGN
ncbi:MAG TPA: peptidylprolyl isomerase [Rhodanobacteraceae bacterium]|jgi:peptidyl-prolyl cis-trans isomerase C|nr:peptidylprolyl isomerase [Rhodanobacteraceae bacterium]